MKSAKWAALLAVAMLAACGGDSGKGTEPRGETVPPPAPGNLRVEKIGDGEIWLKWSAAGRESEVFYVVYRAENGGATVAVDSTFHTTFKDRGLRYESEYSYRVTAVRGSREGAASNAVGGQPFNNLAPLAPTQLRAVAHNIAVLAQLDIVLDWDANEEADLVGYRVYRSTQENIAPDPALLHQEVSAPRLADRQVEVGTRYYYRVTAVDRGGKESPPSRVVTDLALPAAEPVAPVEGELTSSKPMFRWRPLPGARTYRVVVTSSPTSGEISEMPLLGDTTAVFAGRVRADGAKMALEPGKIYYWKVIASTREDGLENSVSRVESFKIR